LASDFHDYLLSHSIHFVTISLSRYATGEDGIERSFSLKQSEQHHALLIRRYSNSGLSTSGRLHYCLLWLQRTRFCSMRKRESTTLSLLAEAFSIPIRFLLIYPVLPFQFYFIMCLFALIDEDSFCINYVSARGKAPRYR
jgi:hypothetical protein